MVPVDTLIITEVVDVEVGARMAVEAETIYRPLAL
jgi:hypothetical protein